MIIDGRTLSINYSGYDANKVVYVARSDKKLAALQEYQPSVGEKHDIFIDYSKGDNPNFTGFKTPGEFTTDGSKMIEFKLIRPFEQDYSFEDALNANWKASTKSDIFNGFRSNATVADEAVMGMDKEQFLAHVRENGLEKGINWNIVDANLNMHTGIDFNDFSAFTDYAAAVYASVESRIMTDFTGDEQAEQLNKLNGIYDNVIEQKARFYVGMINEYVKPMGVSVPDEEIAAGFRDVMMSKKEAYSEFAKNNPDYANLADSEDKWLERDIGYMANALRKAYKPDVETEGNFKENDIIAIGMLASYFSPNSAELNMSSCCDFSDEESIGLAIAMNYLALATIRDDFGVNDTVKQFSANLFDKYAQSVIDRENRGLTYQRSFADKCGYSPAKVAPLDTDDIFAVVNTMINTYEKTKDAEKAIYATTSYAYNKYTEKEKKAEYAVLWRYNGNPGTLRGADFWHSLYDNGEGKSFLGTVIYKWNKFASAMNNAIGNKDYNQLAVFETTSFHMYREWRWLEKPLIGGYSPSTGWWGDRL